LITLSRVGISLSLSPSSRPGAKDTNQEDQFTALRNSIGHPSITTEPLDLGDKVINQLSSIVCCAIEDLPLGN